MSRYRVTFTGAGGETVEADDVQIREGGVLVLYLGASIMSRKMVKAYSAGRWLTCEPIAEAAESAPPARFGVRKCKCGHGDRDHQGDSGECLERDRFAPCGCVYFEAVL